VSFLNQKGIYALVYTNLLDVAKRSGVYAVIKICYGNDADGISVAYTKMGDDGMGYEIPNASVVVNGKVEKIPFLGGKLWVEIVELARVAIERVKEKFPKVSPGKLFKVYKDQAGHHVVEQIGETT